MRILRSLRAKMLNNVGFFLQHCMKPYQVNKKKLQIEIPNKSNPKR
jgi:hypothetical protein